MKTIIFVALFCVCMFANADTWTSPEKDYELEYTQGEKIPFDQMYMNRQPAEANCTRGRYYRFYSILATSESGRKIIFYTQYCK